MSEHECLRADSDLCVNVCKEIPKGNEEKCGWGGGEQGGEEAE